MACHSLEAAPSSVIGWFLACSSSVMLLAGDAEPDASCLASGLASDLDAGTGSSGVWLRSADGVVGVVAGDGEALSLVAVDISVGGEGRSVSKCDQTRLKLQTPPSLQSRFFRRRRRYLRLLVRTMDERPHHIPIPPTAGLRSAMKHTSYPSTPLSSSSAANSPPLFASLLLGQPLSATTSAGSSSSPNIGTRNYLPKVSFDTFENSAASMFSFTLQVKSEGYRRNRSTRVFLCAASPDESGNEALGWVMESLVQDGDELIVFRGLDADELGTF